MSTRSERTHDKRILNDILYELKDDEDDEKVTPYSYFNDALGGDKDVQKECRALLSEVRQEFFRREGVLFEAVRNVGLRRCNDHRKIHNAKSELKNARGCAQRAIAKTMAVENFDTLTPADKAVMLTSQTVAGTIEVTTRPSSFAALQKRVEIVQRPLAPDEAIDELKKGKSWAQLQNSLMKR